VLLIRSIDGPPNVPLPRLIQTVPVSKLLSLQLWPLALIVALVVVLIGERLVLITWLRLMFLLMGVIEDLQVGEWVCGALGKLSFELVSVVDMVMVRELCVV
jgi:hypothetical protein